MIDIYNSNDDDLFVILLCESEKIEFRVFKLKRTQYENTYMGNREVFK